MKDVAGPSGSHGLAAMIHVVPVMVQAIKPDTGAGKQVITGFALLMSIWNLDIAALSVPVIILHD